MEVLRFVRGIELLHSLLLVRGPLERPGIVWSRVWADLPSKQRGLTESGAPSAPSTAQETPTSPSTLASLHTTRTRMAGHAAPGGFHPHLPGTQAALTLRFR